MVANDPLPNLGQVALTAALAGATAIRSVVDTGRLGTEFKSGGHDMVTAADKASERAVIDVIRSMRPDDSILGEEGGVHHGNRRFAGSWTRWTERRTLSTAGPTMPFQWAPKSPESRPPVPSFGPLTVNGS